MKIGLIDVDGHNFPNLCLMKISAHHKRRGDDVEWWNGFKHYDIVYKSRVFTDEYTSDETTAINADQVITGGTGYGLDNRLPEEIEHIYPDYPLYTGFENTAYGFLTRGCPRACPFCIVAKKEGRVSSKVANLTEFWSGQKTIKLLDPNLLACRDHEQLLWQLADSGAWVDFTQGLDIRLLTRDNIRLLNGVKSKVIHFAWDNPDDDLTGYFQFFQKYTTISKHRKPGVYVLTNYDSTIDQDLYRIYTLRALGYDLYVMVYNKPSAPQLIRDLQRWCNNRVIFNAEPNFKNYVKTN